MSHNPTQTGPYLTIQLRTRHPGHEGENFPVGAPSTEEGLFSQVNLRQIYLICGPQNHTWSRLRALGTIRKEESFSGTKLQNMTPVRLGGYKVSQHPWHEPCVRHGCFCPKLSMLYN